MRARFDNLFVEDYAHIVSMSWLAYFMATAVASTLPMTSIPRGPLLVLCMAAGTTAAALLRRPHELTWLALLCGAGASVLSLLPEFALWLPMFQFVATFGLMTSPVLVVFVRHARERSSWKGLVVLAGLVLVLSLPLATEGIWDAWTRGSALIDYESVFIGLPMSALVVSVVWAFARRSELSTPVEGGSWLATLIGWAIAVIAIGWWAGDADGPTGWLFAAGLSAAVVLVQRPVLRELGPWRAAGAVVATVALVIALQTASQEVFLAITAA